MMIGVHIININRLDTRYEKQEIKKLDLGILSLLAMKMNAHNWSYVLGS
jgi:hypothetical protein